MTRSGSAFIEIGFIEPVYSFGLFPERKISSRTPRLPPRATRP